MFFSFLPLNASKKSWLMSFGLKQAYFYVLDANVVVKGESAMSNVVD